MRYILLDRITELSPEKGLGIKCISLSDDVFVDHFPGHPLMPGALLLESMAQLGGVVVEAAMRAQDRHDLHALLVQADRLKFRRMVRPGDQIFLEAKCLAVSEDAGRVHVVCRLDKQVVAEGDLTFAFTQIKNPVVLTKRKEVLNTWLYGSTEEL